ncbi:tyrosine-protein phosphatase 99A-like isoform X1 [Microplitis mediator]|uniref:tyrosine-protein phosphatase 99A-like isoform X1 n=1 Tax=Microplitis mediator TaxID=375433 RepID=UPI002552A732|nr:tyrosine-protein phosphatase 99A-like isoform X1 [Microplitis mediator]
MNVCRQDWIIYACLIWFLIETGATGRVFDVPDPIIKHVLADAGQNVTLECPGVTERSVVSRLVWRANDYQIVEYGSQSITYFVHHNRIILSDKNFTLFFQPVQSEDSGEYQCIVNSRNIPEVIVNLTVQDVPDPPGRPIATNFTSRSVTISWAPSENSHNNPISHYIINVRVGENGPWDHQEIVTSNNDTKYYMDNLLPFTSYSFRVTAVNARGRSSPSVSSHYITTLREAPAGKPTIVTAQNISATAILITWKPPSLDTLNGEFLGYRISYRPRRKGSDIKEIYIRNRKIERHIIQNLETYTQYTVWLQVFNPEGTGPNTSVTVMTDEGIPSTPLRLTAYGINSSSVELSWSEPKHKNGIILGYRVFYMHSNFTEVKTLKKNNETIDFLLNDLKPMTEYKIWVKAFTWKNEGEPSDHIIQKTDVAGPTAPVILNLTCQAHDAIYVYWARPETFWNSIDYYYIMYRNDQYKKYDEIEIPTTKEHLNSGIIIPNLTMNTIYEIMVCAGTNSTINPHHVVRGNCSQPKTQRVARNCDKTPPLMRRSSEELSTGVIAGMICVCIAVMLAITALILWRRVFRKCFQTTYCFLDYPPRNVQTHQEWENSKQDGERTAVPVSQYVQHVAALHADGDIGFSKEFELFPKETELYIADNSKSAENQSKNRYGNIIAYDHSRVRLLPCNGSPSNKGQDYINANYIDGWQRARAYIGTQGPLPGTIDSFWRMVWEQRVSIIVMITNLVERGRPKCDMYWPKEGTETYGNVQVTLIKEDVMATYTIRTLHIRHMKIKKKKNGSNVGERTVYQYHYTGWPDHGVPDHPLPVLSFIRKSSSANPPSAGPIIVHCSAGVGRTGAYIVIDAMLKQAKCKGEINVYGFLKHIRTQRYSLVQTEEQYIFIHDALQEAIDSGETNTPIDNLLQHVQDMLSPQNNKTDPWNNIEMQYKLVTSWKPKDFNLVSSSKSFNQHKNRNQEIVPIENSRVHLTPKAGIDGSDYINATWFAGFHKNREFILTQHPLKTTIKEFWQMLWDHNAKTIVMLTQCDDNEYPEFWPNEGEELKTDNFRVQLCAIKKTVSGVVLREVVIRSLQDDYELSARIVQGPVNHNGLWPHNDNPKAFVSMIQDFHKEYQNGPIVVMDRYGGIEAALFILLTTLMKQIEFEKSADIYMFSKLLYMKRPGIFRSKEDYVLVYKCLESVLTSKTRVEPDLYTMTNGHVNCINPNDGNNFKTTTIVPTVGEQHIVGQLPVKNVVGIHEYASVEMPVEYATDYVNNQNHLSHINNERGCPTIDGCADYGDHHILTDNAGLPVRNQNYVNHPGVVGGVAAGVPIDPNGYITNGNMRIPPEGMESTCAIIPQ